jgi:hypothetical protein
MLTLLVAVTPERYQDRDDFSYRLIPVMGMGRRR